MVEVPKRPGHHGKKMGGQSGAFGVWNAHDFSKKDSAGLSFSGAGGVIFLSRLSWLPRCFLDALFWRQASASVVSVHVELVVANWMHPKLAQNSRGNSKRSRRFFWVQKDELCWGRAKTDSEVQNVNLKECLGIVYGNLAHGLTVH
jgi:hypothetical protein